MFQSRTVILDSNLMLVWVIGRVDRGFVEQFGRTRSYSSEDYDTLVDYLTQFRAVLVTPNIATEVNNLFLKLKGERLTNARAMLAEGLREWEEEYVPSRTAAADPEFLRVGLTDAGVLHAASKGIEVATDDLQLYRLLLDRGVTAVNFNHIRTRYWL